MYKVGDKVLCQTSPNMWMEGVIQDDALAVGHWWVDLPGERVLAHERTLKPCTSPNELTVVVNIDASAALAELDGLGEMITQRVKGAVAAGLAGETEDLVRERDALREELAACKRERDATVSHLEELVNDITWERDEARTKLMHANAEAAGSGRACADLRAECEAMRKERDDAKAAVAEAVARLADFKAQLRTALGYLAQEEEV